MPQERCIVVTSIFSPTEAVTKFSQLKEWKLIVVGDKKSPQDWSCPKVDYLSVATQDGLTWSISSLLPWNHYCRKMLGYLHAIKAGATMIVDTDDDNIPLDDWSVPSFEGEFHHTQSDLGFVNIYKNFTKMHIWPRGFPLDAIRSAHSLLQEADLTTRPSRVGIWQGLADADPDVDAIYRLVSNEPCYFNKRPPIVLAKGTICPFNSQNTAFRSEVFPLLYLPTEVTFRYTDILRGLVAQPILWALNYSLGFTQATVIQERNPHDYLRDFESEIPCYLYPRKVLEIVTSAVSASESVASNLFNAYSELHRNQIVPAKELEVLSAWLKDLSA